MCPLSERQDQQFLKYLKSWESCSIQCFELICRSSFKPVCLVAVSWLRYPPASKIFWPSSPSSDFCLRSAYKEADWRPEIPLSRFCTSKLLSQLQVWIRSVEVAGRSKGDWWISGNARDNWPYFHEAQVRHAAGTWCIQDAIASSSRGRKFG